MGIATQPGFHPGSGCQLMPFRRPFSDPLLLGFNLPSILKDVKIQAWTIGKKRFAFKEPCFVKSYGKNTMNRFFVGIG